MSDTISDVHKACIVDFPPKDCPWINPYPQVVTGDVILTDRTTVTVNSSTKWHILESSTGVVASVDIPGVKFDSLNVEIDENGTITVQGRRPDRSNHSIFESCYIGNSYDATKAGATLQDGVLQVVVPKRSGKIVKHRVLVQKK